MEFKYTGESKQGEEMFTKGLEVPKAEGIDPVEGHKEFFPKHQEAIKSLATLENLKTVGNSIVRGAVEIGTPVYATFVAAHGAWGHLHGHKSQEIAMTIAGIAAVGGLAHTFMKLIKGLEGVHGAKREALQNSNSAESAAGYEFWSTHTWEQDDRGVMQIVTKTKE